MEKSSSAAMGATKRKDEARVIVVRLRAGEDLDEIRMPQYLKQNEWFARGCTKSRLTRLLHDSLVLNERGNNPEGCSTVSFVIIYHLHT